MRLSDVITLAMFCYLACLLSSCSTMPKDFKPYVDSFRADSGQTRHVDVEFGTPRASEKALSNLAECLPGNQMFTPRVVVDETQWEKLSTVGKKALVYHELGHCLLGLSHTTTGLMQSDLISDEEFLKLKRGGI